MPRPLQSLDEIFHAALEISDPAKRAAFLDRACAGDERARRQIEALLRAEFTADDFFKTRQAASESTPDNVANAPAHLGSLFEKSGSVIGQYEVIEKLGEGGFGIVYRARQSAPVRREVALKIIKPGMDTREVVRRFEAERQALALMSHPNIAAVHDAGATPTGRPYFVMELVRGRSITPFCDAELLTVPDRLELFIQVCRAVQHAHHKGIIHRDLKPSNILVNDGEGQPVPKIIDFGIAKATGRQLTTETLATRAQEVIGTPAYMSPEQASPGQQDIDTRSDIYSLGVLMYELLTGYQPFDEKRLQSSSLEVVLKIIREEDPCTPSARVAQLPDTESRTIAGLRQSDVRRLRRALRGDLDWIVMKALEKDRNRRYESANALSEDIQRFLNHEPVSAAAPGAIYQFQKMACRHRTAFAAAGAIAAILLLSSIVSAWLAVRATRAEHRSALEAVNAKRQAAVAEAARKFLTEDVLGAADPMEVNRMDMRVREALDKAARRLDQQFRDEPLVEAEIRATLTRIYSNLGEDQRALPHARRALELRRRELGETAPETLKAKRSVGLLYLGLRNQDPKLLPKAESILREALAASQKFLLPGDEVTVDIRTALASALFASEQHAESRQLAEEALHSWTNTHGLYNPRSAHIIVNFAGNYALHPGEARNENKERHLFELALDVSQKTFGKQNPQNILRLINLATFHLNTGRFTEALPLLDEAVTLAKTTVGNTHPWMWSALATLTRARLQEGNFPAATAAAEEEFATRSNAQQPDDPSIIEAVTRISDGFENHGATNAALVFYRKGLQRLGAGRPKELKDLAHVTYWMVATGEYQSAFETWHKIDERVSSTDPDSTNYLIPCRATLLAMMARGSERCVEECRQLLQQFAGTKTPRIAAEVARICLLVREPLSSEEVARLDRLVALVRQSVNLADNESKSWLQLTLGMNRYRAGDLENAIEVLEAVSDTSGVCRATARLVLGMAYRKHGEHDTAESAFAEGRRLMEAVKRSKFSWWQDHLLFLIMLKEADQGA